MYKLIFWLIDCGAVDKVLVYGWQKQAARQLNVHRITLNRNVEILVEHGVLIQGKKRGEVGLNSAIFEHAVDTSEIEVRL